MATPIPLPLVIPLPDGTPPDEEVDKPIPGELVGTTEFGLSTLIFGTGTFSNQYNTNDHLSSFTPMRMVRLALRYGIRAFDTSIYYGPSEVVLGNALKTIEKGGEFTRGDYQLLTKCGRFGVGTTTFDYSPSTIRQSVEHSLARLQTDYLDVVYLHDTEFVAECAMPRASGNHKGAIGEESAQYGLAPGDEAVVRGEGDKKVLGAWAELRAMKAEGKIRKIGLTGYPIATVLRLALLILYTPPFEPVDIVMSYAHLSLQNTLFADFAAQFKERAKVEELVTASPFNMGLLTPNIPPWHPAPPELKDAIKRATEELGEDIFTDLALGYAIRRAEELSIPLVTGFSSEKEVHECVRNYREIKQGGETDQKRKEREEQAREVFREAGWLDWSWASP
ncbi:l-galactose dehydrogenase (l-) [Moniliophthora roreri MCA 2997]|uniref:L-galactose dehydrogenase (L-) n=2 Tax=Moniliophthora roreri TaxID=221103 RepID=V2XIM8_MONRO|nr:l-galactose dehydrogenase (l-) [Moniliophthora roreri MCA 2997]